jgi:hypothetical protein
MKTHGRKYLVFIVLFALLVPLGAWAKRPDPFAGPSKEMTVSARYAITVNLPADAPARTEFFRLSELNTGYNEAKLTELVNAGKVAVIYCTDKTCQLETAGLHNGKAVYHRDVNEKEAVVVVAKGDWWVPWFLLGCNNPVRPVEPEKPVTMAPSPPPEQAQPPQQREVHLQQMVCMQSGPVNVFSDTTFYSGHTEHQFNGLYNPTTCFVITEKIFLEGGAQ